MKFMNIVYGLVFFIVGAVIVLTVMPALLPTFYTGLNTTANYAYTTGGTTYALPLANLFALNGILPLVIVAAVFVALVVGAIAMIKGGKSR
jgi:uncharacterized membrane protein